MIGTYGRLNVHVYASDLEVIRALRRKLRPEVLHDRSLRGQRHKIYRAILAEHKAARELCARFRL
jgi:hypothetical protein